ARVLPATLSKPKTGCLELASANHRQNSFTIGVYRICSSLFTKAGPKLTGGQNAHSQVRTIPLSALDLPKLSHCRCPGQTGPGRFTESNSESTQTAKRR